MLHRKLPKDVDKLQVCSVNIPPSEELRPILLMVNSYRIYSVDARVSIQ